MSYTAVLCVAPHENDLEPSQYYARMRTGVVIAVRYRQTSSQRCLLSDDRHCFHLKKIQISVKLCIWTVSFCYVLVQCYLSLVLDSLHREKFIKMPLIVDKHRTVAEAATSPLANQMTEIFRRVPRDKIRPLVAPLVLSQPLGCDVSSPPSTPSPDNPDNRDTCVLHPDTRDMYREEERLKTFDKWPVSFLTPEQLAKNGFYYVGRGDEVRCAFCKVEIMRWFEGDDPAKDHQRWAPQCPFLRRKDSSGNIPLDENRESSGRDECGLRVRSSSPNPVRMPGPAHAKYASEAARLASFQDWPRCMKQKPEELAEAGFFYMGQGDKTKCFYCDGGLKDWEPDDIPWEQHARWFDRCAYVQLVKGRDYIQKVMSEACAISKDKEETAPAKSSKDKEETGPAKSDKDETPVDDSNLCRICYVGERNVCFVPCGHVVACAKCALSTNCNKCPMCRRTFTNAVRLYYS